MLEGLSMIQKTVSEILKMLGSNSENTAFDDVMIQGVCIDSRNVEKGNLFIPLKGERVNGHAYASMAIEKGAAALLWEVNEPDPPKDIALIFVEDCAKALWQLAAAYRSLCHYKVVGITGSNGKTSTKDMVAGVLSEQFKVMKTQGNHNNEIGVPLTLLSFDEDIDVAVVEMGMENLHEIEDLCKIVKPDIGIITNVGVAHLENLGSMENIAKAKCELIEGIRQAGTFIYNGDDPYLAQEVCNHDLSHVTVKTFGEGEHNLCALTSFSQSSQGITFKHSMSELTYNCDILGRHQAMNGCAAYLVGHELGMCDEAIQRGFHRVVPTSMRNELVTVGKWTVLNDAYKSNPQSALAALSTFDQLPGINRIAVLGDMLELGETSPTLHEQLGLACGNFKLDKVFCLGEMAQYIAKGALAAGIKDVRHYTDREALLSALLDETENEATVLFKGSRGMKLDEILDQIKGR